ncbi:Hsp20/alpha crystallin family protein [Natrialba sp. INN-245]|uniref:Hsp20/alpha crystallin family protein n=1 Tax=Natrialba sp. INN-245 TaxID=2690967 RepID=UPI0013126DD1|nr:Hsp20/alpha crystallin family protein [Natrialba sp. INN-245]MWV39694.1 Hsp20/alpha crystallin family protein [Natrialba sp. INN-245]
MTEDDHDPDDRPGGPDDETERNRDEQDDDHWLSSLLSALEGLEDRSSSTRRRGGRSMFDVDLSIRGVDDESRPGRGPLAGGGPTGHPRDRRDHEPRGKRTRKRSASRPSVATRRYDDEILLTADVGDADPEDVTVGFEDGTLVVGLEGRELDRIEVPWSDHTAEAGIRNGVLTVRVEPGSKEGRDGTGVDRADDEAGDVTDDAGSDATDDVEGDETTDTEVDDE